MRVADCDGSRKKDGGAEAPKPRSPETRASVLDH